MTIEFLQLIQPFNTLTQAAAAVIGSFLFGILVERIIIARVQRAASHTSWKTDDALITGTRGSFSWLFLLAGVWWASRILEYQHPWFSRSVLIVGVLLVARILERILVQVVEMYTHKDAKAPKTSIFGHLTRIIVYTLAAVVILQTLGVEVTAVLGALGVGGIAAAFAVKDTLSNVFAGVQILSSKEFKPGDFISVEGDKEGTVVDITWRMTTLRTISNNLVMIPNSKLATATITNNSRPSKERFITMTVGVSYDSNLEKVEKVVRDVVEAVLKEVDRPGTGKPPIVRFKSFDSSSILLSIGATLSSYTKQFEYKHQLVKALHQRFKKEKVTIPFPTQTVHIKKR